MTGQDRSLEIGDPTGVSTRYEYDILGRRSRIFNDDGLEVRYGYDALNRIRHIRYGNGVEPPVPTMVTVTSALWKPERAKMSCSPLHTGMTAAEAITANRHTGSSGRHHRRE